MMRHSYPGGLQAQQLLFACGTIGIAAEATVGGDDAVAGDDEGNGIAADGLADCPGGTAIKEPGEVAIGAGLAVRDGEEYLPDTALERCAVRMEAGNGMRLTAGKIIVQPMDGLGYYGV